MRIAMISEHASPLAVLGGVDAGGQNVHVDALSRRLAHLGHEVAVYTRRDDPDLPATVHVAPGLDVVHVDAGPAEHLPKDELLPFMPAFGDVLRRAWAGRPPDVVHAHFWMSGVAGLRATAGTGVPLVQTFHALGSVKRRYQGAKDTSPHERIGLEAHLCASVTAVVATCTDEVGELVALGMDPRRVTVVPCGVDLARFTPALDRATRARRPEDDRFRALCVGRLVERKGTETVVRALAAMPALEVVVAGGPPASELGSDDEARRLLALADELGVRDRLRLVGGVSQQEVRDLMRAADVVVCDPWYEPFGIVPLEAAACGRPVVGAAVGGLLDTVLPDRTGVLVPPRDTDALVGALERLHADPREAERLGAAARVRAERYYGWETVARRTLDTYRAVAAGHDVARVPVAHLGADRDLVVDQLAQAATA